MSKRQLLAWVAVFVSVGLALLGFLLFVIGVFVEFFNTQSVDLRPLSPNVQIGLAGLCLSALMVVLGFALVMLLLARQTRQQAPGYGDAYRFMETMQFSQAIPVLERAVETGRETSDVLAMLTSAYAHTGQLAKAQATADRAIQLYPDDPSAYVTLANGYRMQASYEEAARALRAAIELAPTQAFIWAELAFVERMAGDENAAFEAFKQAAQSPMPAMYGVRVYYHLAQAYKTFGDAEQASLATAKMMSARGGLDAWKPLQQAMEGTAYGQALHYEIASIEAAIGDADAASLG